MNPSSPVEVASSSSMADTELPDKLAVQRVVRVRSFVYEQNSLFRYVNQSKTKNPKVYRSRRLGKPAESNTTKITNNSLALMQVMLKNFVNLHTCP